MDPNQSNAPTMGADLVSLAEELIAPVRLPQLIRRGLRRLRDWAPDTEWAVLYRKAPASYDVWSTPGAGPSAVTTLLRATCSPLARLDGVDVGADRATGAGGWVRVPPRRAGIRDEPDLVLGHWGPGLPRPLRQRVAELLCGASRSARVIERLLEQTVRDSLTGLLNRRGLGTIIERERGRARMLRRPLSLLFADLDGFKHLNDRHGHAVGDEVLRGVARFLENELRADDSIARFGGDEFVIVLPQTGRRRARQIAERLGRSLRSTPLETTAGALSVEMTTGSADLGEADDEQALLALADRRMLARKRIRDGRAPRAVLDRATG